MKRLILKNILLVFCIASVVFGMAVESRANPTSTFDTDLDGWTGLTGESSVVWMSTDGNPAGFLTCSDIGSGAAFVFAPPKFLGAWPTTGFVSADVKSTDQDGGTISAGPEFHLRSGATRYRYNFSDATTNWVTYSAPLSLPGTGWVKAEGSLSFAEVLTDVQEFRICLDFVNGGDEQSGLDNVSRPATPPPPEKLVILHKCGACWWPDTGWDVGNPYTAGFAWAVDWEFHPINPGEYVILHKAGAVWKSWLGTGGNWDTGDPYTPGGDWARDIEISDTSIYYILHKAGARWNSDTGWDTAEPYTPSGGWAVDWEFEPAL